MFFCQLLTTHFAILLGGRRHEVVLGDWHKVRYRDGGQEGGDVLGGVDVPHILGGLLPTVGHVQALQGRIKIKYPILERGSAVLLLLLLPHAQGTPPGF